MKKIFSFSILVFLISFAFYSCFSQKPVPIKMGEHRCAYCKMHIADARFNAQIVNPNGKADHFDSIECMTAYKIKKKEEGSSHNAGNEDKQNKFYVKDIMRKDQYVEAHKAYYLQSQDIPSPMGAHLSAYSNTSQLEETRKKHPGKKLTFDQVERYIKKVWLK